MKRIYIIALLSFLMIAPLVTPEAEAQNARKERVAAKRKKNRKVKRKVRRRVSRRAHLRYASLTKYGTSVRVVPKGAVVVKKSNMTYHYHNGLFYRPFGKTFLVVKPAIGIRLKSLPARHVKVMVPRGTYYYYYGTYYRKSGVEYEVVPAPSEAIVDAIPEGYDVKQINGSEYYVWDGVYYQEVEADNFESGTGYQVATID